MKTNVKIPKFLEKFLNIYSVATLGIGFIVIVLVNSANLKLLTGQVEAYTNGSGDIVNVCGGVPFQIEPSIWSDPVREQCRYGSFTCNDAGCNAMTEECYINIFRCEEGEEASNGYECLVNPDEDSQGERIFYETATYSMLFNNNPDPYHPSELPTDCLMLQIDLVCNGGSTDFVVWRGGRFGSPECGAPPPPRPECGDGVIDPGEECDPPGNTSQCSYGACQSDCTCPEPPPEGECGDGIIDPDEECDPPGNTDQCTYGECSRNCTCPGALQQEPGIEIEKLVRDGRHQYGRRENVVFDITITNTGNVVFEEVEFFDHYDPNHLEFAGISGSRMRNGSVVVPERSLISISEIRDRTDGRREIYIENLASSSVLGNLGVGESFSITLTYRTEDIVGEVTTWNYAIVATETEYEEGRDWVDIVYNPPVPPPTDR